MLQHVRVQNIALIDEADIDFDEGMNALTGETGAGKSILLGAINLALGKRAGKDIVRDTSRGAEVDLLFNDDRAEVKEALAELGIDSDDGEVLIVRRFTPSGRGTLMINGAMASTAEVKRISSLLIDIHGQHEHQSLLNPAKHIELLDRFIPKMPAELSKMKALWDEAEKVRKELEAFQANARDRSRVLSLMEFEIGEIEDSNWREGEEEELKEERQKLLYAERLKEASLEAASLMQDNDYGASALSKLDDALAKIKSVVAFDEAFFEPFAETLEDQISVLEDTASELRSYGEDLEADPERLNEIEDRISLILHLKDKYGRSYEEVQRYLKQRKEEYDKLYNAKETIEKLEAAYESLKGKMKAQAAVMTELRKKAGERIGRQITEVLSTLQFEEPIFQVSCEEKEVSQSGADQVVFMIRTNVGEKIMPLDKIASGGEMSRVMLAIKTVLAEEDEIGTMIFDEIDTGISGRTAQSVAEKMSRIGHFHQVICVTHLPQIAAMADNHLRIEKVTEGGRAYTRVKRLSGEEITEELSRMLGGTKITEAVRQNAVEMKALAEQLKATWK